MPKQIYWWAIGVDPFTGKRGIIGPYSSDSELQENARGKIQGIIEPVALPTRNKDTAKSMLRAKLSGDEGFMDLGPIGSL